ncbi:hypothetical protein BKA63DRAFT_24982 [Paraphoma chrysanthemicola]|nr:hypothetical protein BKA63DRAFT_24982 [Paraphoma chrysanthemicola]
METSDVKYSLGNKACCFRTGKEGSYFDAKTCITDDRISAPSSEMMEESLNPDNRHLQEMGHRSGPLSDYPDDKIFTSRDLISSHGQWQEYGQHFGGSLSHHGSVTEPHVGMWPIEDSLEPYHSLSATNDTLDMTTAPASGSNNDYVLPTIICGDQDRESLILSHTGDAYGVAPPNTTSNHSDGTHRLRQQDGVDALGWTELSANGAVEQKPAASSQWHEFRGESWLGSERTHSNQKQAQSANRSGGYDEYSPNYRMLLYPSPWTPLSIVGTQIAPVPLSSGWHPSTSSHRGSSMMLSTSAATSSSHRASSEMSDASRDQTSSQLTNSTLTVRLEAPSVALKCSKKPGSSGACSKSKRNGEHPRHRPCEVFAMKSDRSSPSDDHIMRPRNAYRNSDASSPSSSFSSDMPSSDQEPLPCPEVGCIKAFKGVYRRGTLQRHIRLKHGEEEREYRCEAGCTRSYLRQDARLKHYRNQHPDFDAPAIIPRAGRVPGSRLKYS